MNKSISFSPKVEIYGDKSAIIEFQAFKGNENEFIIKELVILDLKTNIPNYFLFKPPFSFSHLNRKQKKTNNWCTRRHHLITWDEGFTNYEELDNIMYHYCTQFTSIFSTGLEKCNWIRMYTTSKVIERTLSKELRNNENLVCTSVKNVNHNFPNCALAKAHNLSLTLSKNLTNVKSGGGGVGGGGKVYKNNEETFTFHEYYANLCERRSSEIPSEEKILANTNMNHQNLQDLAKLFNQHSKSAVLVTKKCNELKEERRYVVHAFKRIDTSVGDGILATLSEAPFKEGDHPKFQIFLPKRFVITLQNEHLDVVQPGKLYIVSHGSSGNNSTELTLHVNED